MTAQGILIYGETCAGKSTIGKLLGSTLGGHYVSFGDLKRDHIRDRTRIGRSIERCLGLGEPIPPQLGFRVIEPEIKPGLSLISGYPISDDEFDLLSEHCLVHGVVVLTIDESTLIHRFFGRRVCPQCHHPGAEGDICVVHGLSMVGRPDVDPVELLNRRRLYKDRISPFLNTLEGRIPRLDCDASDLTPVEIAKNVTTWATSLPGSL